MYTALYRKERPEVFSEILGQEHIVKILKNQLLTGTVSHAYLFCGTRGTGKTTTARILAKAVNCVDPVTGPCGKCESCMAIKEGRFMDVIEIDAASNNGVENIREINESVKYPPQVGRKKVYIIDEVHMLSQGAFNALLKTLEEPPEYVMFILATTEPEKLPQTILSRCMRLDFKRVPESVIIEGMRKIVSERGVEITEDGLKLLASNADGSVRDGLSILDQCLSSGEKKIDRDLILEFLGTVGDEFFIDLADKVSLGDISGALLLLNQVICEGKDVKQLMKDLNSHYRNLLITKYVKDAEGMLNMSSENLEKLKEQSAQITLEEIDRAIVILSRTINEARWSTQPRILLEMALVEIAQERAVEVPVVVKKNERPVKKETNLGDTWQRLFEKCEEVQKSFNIIRSQARLVEVDKDKFKIAVDTQIAERMLEESRQLVEETMKELTGAGRMLIQKAETKIQEEKDDLAQQVSKMLGIDVEMK